MPSYTSADLRDAVRELITNDKNLRDEVVERWKEEVGRKMSLETRADEAEDYRINKWGYAVIGALVGLFFASDPGGLSEIQGYALGFTSVYLALSLLELLAQRRLGKKHS